MQRLQQGCLSNLARSKQEDGFVHGDHPLMYDILHESWDHIPNHSPNFRN
jgi:hypothetical protein